MSLSHISETFSNFNSFSFSTLFSEQNTADSSNKPSCCISVEKKNSTLAAILGTTKKSIKDLTDEARRLGATTSYTAAQVTALQIELAKLGFFKEDIKAMTPSVLKFAKAVDTDLASADDLQRQIVFIKENYGEAMTKADEAKDYVRNT